MVSPGERVVVIRDGDEEGSPADKALVVGADALLLQGAAEVKVTSTPRGEDANSILQAGGVEALAELIDPATPVALSREGKITELAGDAISLDFDKERKQRRNWRSASPLDAEIAKRQPKFAAPST